jgi:predicted aldo/keto reductase-like oxidoreductase
MEYRRFGRTNLKMPVFSCGGMRYQNSWSDQAWDEIPAVGQENLEKVIHRSLELGINHIETARGYGTSEMQLGKILPRLPREKMIVQTKVAPNETREGFLETFETSMRHLGLDYVDLFSIHGVNNEELLDLTLKRGGSLDAARELQRQGRVRFIGFSTHAATETILRAIETDAFDYVNLHWYFVNQFNWSAVQAATLRDMGVFIISPNDKGGKLYEPPAKLVDLCRPLSPMQFNDLFCLARPEVHTLSIGASKPSDFDEHIAALEHYQEAERVSAPIAERLTAEMRAVLGDDWVDGWWHGIPPFEKIPGHVNVREIIRLWNFAKALDMVAFGKLRYNLMGNGGHWFPGVNASEYDIAAVRAALAESPFAERISTLLGEAHEILSDAPTRRLGSH